MIKLLVFLFLPSFSFAQNFDFYKKYWNLPPASFKELEKNTVLVDATVESEKEKQNFSLKAMALHQKNCATALRKLSLLENYPEWISFIKTSLYEDSTHLWTIKADHALLPYPMLVHIIVKRPTTQGEYPFVFPTGMFKGLKGKFIIQENNNRCLFFAQSYWQGEKTKLPDFVIELFSETLSRLGGEILMRKTQF